jgi:integrase
MTPRKASLRVAHQAQCPHANKTALDSLRGCKCSPSYYVTHRDASGATVKSARVKDRRVADKLLRAKQVEIDEGRVGVVPERNVTFPEWVDEYLDDLDRRPGIKATTRDTYARSLEIARDAIGYVPVRQIGNRELRKFHDAIRHGSEATQIKHLSHLSACLAAAVPELADRNPVGPFRKNLRLRPAKGTSAFNDGELARLLNALRHEEPVYLAIVRAAVETGARIGELIALDWRDVDLIGGKITIQHTYSPLGGLTVPKDSEPRDVYLTPRAARVFDKWVRRVGVEKEGIVFPAPRSGGYVNADYLRKLILAAMTTAGIAKVDPQSGRPRKPLHSLRATFTRRMLEQGKSPLFVQSQLGHAGLELTLGVYGQWTAEALRAEAMRGARVG